MITGTILAASPHAHRWLRMFDSRTVTLVDAQTHRFRQRAGFIDCVNVSIPHLTSEQRARVIAYLAEEMKETSEMVAVRLDHPTGGLKLPLADVFIDEVETVTRCPVCTKPCVVIGADDYQHFSGVCHTFVPPTLEAT